jgi:hypothetical protein
MYYIHSEGNEEWLYDPKNKKRSPKSWGRNEIIDWLADRHIAVTMDDCDVADSNSGSPWPHSWTHHIIEMKDNDQRWFELRMRFW